MVKPDGGNGATARLRPAEDPCGGDPHRGLLPLNQERGAGGVECIEFVEAIAAEQRGQKGYGENLLQVMALRDSNR